MGQADDRWGWALSFALGAVLWTVIAMAAGQREPWDTGLYWSAGYPLGLLFAGAMGALLPHRTWRWALALTFAQLPVMLLRGSGLGLLPLGVVLTGLLAVPPMLAAKIGAWLRSWLSA